jgi:transposase
MISAETRALILRYYHAEHWKVGTIARQLHIHHSVVRRVLTEDAGAACMSLARAHLIDPYLPFLTKTLQSFPGLTAARLYHMVRSRGYQGSESHFRRMIRPHRPRRSTEAYLRLATLPGEQGQCDWGSFGHMTIGAARRPLMAFVMVLSYSRQIHLRFFLDARMENFLRGHVGAFTAFGGCPRVILYDNLKSAVLERRGEAVRFNPTLLAFAGHYRFEPRPVAVARGNEKGRVERAIRYIRDAFFAGRAFADLADLNRQAADWCQSVAADRPNPGDRARTVRAVFADEQPLLLALPDNPYPIIEQVAVRIGKTPYARFDGNDYTVPHTEVGRTLSVLADPDTVRIVSGGAVLATHARSYDKRAQIEDPSHIEALRSAKAAARGGSGADRLVHAVPASEAFLAAAAARGEPLARIVTALQDLLERYGAAALEAAVKETLAQGVPHPQAVQRVLERSRIRQHKPAPLNPLPVHIKARDVVVRTPKLAPYDELQRPFLPEDTDDDV